MGFLKLKYEEPDCIWTNLPYKYVLYILARAHQWFYNKKIIKRSIKTTQNVNHGWQLAICTGLTFYLSRRRKVESKQLANMQLPSLDIDIQLTGCPKSSEISLYDNTKSSTIREYSTEFKIRTLTNQQHPKMRVHSATYLPMRMSNVLTVPSTLPAMISVFVKQTDMTLSENVSMICKMNHNINETLHLHINKHSQ